MPSHISNCFLAVRPGDGPLFIGDSEGHLSLNLNGYAIVPVEDYAKHAVSVAKCAEGN